MTSQLVQQQQTVIAMIKERLDTIGVPDETLHPTIPGLTRFEWRLSTYADPQSVDHSCGYPKTPGGSCVEEAVQLIMNEIAYHLMPARWEGRDDA